MVGLCCRCCGDETGVGTPEEKAVGNTKNVLVSQARSVELLLLVPASRLSSCL